MKPIAWMYVQEKKPKGRCHIDEIDFANVPDDDWFPVYTHPVKELTDEEIEGIARANVDGHSSMEQLKWFARAILRKAQEK